MIINNQNHRTNFSGIYRLPKTVQNISDIERHVAPMYQDLKHEPILIFEGKNPFKIGVDILMDIIANSHSSSINWLKMNATNHGASFDGLADDIIHIVSGKKEIEQIIEYMKNRLNPKTNFFERAKNFFNFNNSKNYTYQNKPEHLRTFFQMLETNREENIAFENAYKTKIIEVKTPQELLTKMLCEK